MEASRHGPWDYSTNQQCIDDFWRKGIERDKNYEESSRWACAANDTCRCRQARTSICSRRSSPTSAQILQENVTPDLE